jgi:hypothetical protein
MKTLTKIRPRSYQPQYFAVPGHPELVGQLQRGIETIAGHTQWKLHLTLAHSPSQAFATVNHRQQP